MRLICPSCSAQYEVDASLLPDDGTEVQCSSCGTVWFQRGAGLEKAQNAPARARPASASAATPPEPAFSDAPPPAPPQPKRPERPKAAPAETPRPERQRATDPAPAAAPIPDSAPKPTNTAPPPPPPPNRSLDPAVADVLRGEAEFEAKQRAREDNSLETQEELGLFGPALSPPSAKTGASTLPDIDDISSTLEPVDTGRGSQPDLPATEAARKRSFLSGLIVPMVIAACLAGLYLLAPMLAAAVPALEGPMTSYVGLVDSARLAVASLLGATP